MLFCHKLKETQVDIVFTFDNFKFEVSNTYNQIKIKSLMKCKNFDIKYLLLYSILSLLSELEWGELLQDPLVVEVTFDL